MHKGNNDNIPISNCRWLAKGLDCCWIEEAGGFGGEATTTTTTRGESKVVLLVWV
jgi:hypothetical protein